ncbi:MAG: glycoside hydrolase family 3 C-terminal domain-containing protein [Prolixibacteraceae bacterium]|nr:glycoside hydrolase family 3 C-terminal domain-containing protein [Prolixibacteraceae bacterium]
MTLEEKVAQLQIEDFIYDYTDTVKLYEQLKNGLGMLSSYQLNLEQTVKSRNLIQKFIIDNTRLGIPVIFLDEGLHGLMKPNSTSFPQAIGLACSWDTDLYERVFTVVAHEMRSRGAQIALSPVLDVCRDPRWGRVEETYGEDPFLNGILAIAAIKGFQGSADGSIAPGHVAATLKHFVGHGEPENGLNISPCNISERVLREMHMLPFKMTIDSVKPFALMASYNEVDGMPSHKNKWLLRKILREEWGFDGMLISDKGGIEMLYDRHKVANTPEDAALQAFEAGIEVALPGKYYNYLPQLVSEKKIEEKDVDKAVAKILQLKFESGLFDNRYSDPEEAIAISHLESSKKLALEAAEKSIVLLENKNQILPLDIDKYETIAVVGPCANDVSLGGYPGGPYYKTSILKGIQNFVGDRINIIHSKGTTITKDSEKDINYKRWQADSIKFVPREENLQSIKEAVKVARQADIIILCVGETEYICREAWSKTHLGDAATLDLICEQNELAEAMFNTGKPVIVCLSNGRPLSVNMIAGRADALLECWYMGQETGRAVAEILFGKVSPSGKLTITIPRSVGQLPIYYNHKPSARFVDYVTMGSKPLYPFGYGLSYSNFKYSKPLLDILSVKNGAKARVSIDVRNEGRMPADEIVQLYIRDKVSSVSRPIKELKGFKRITLDVGESETVSFEIDHSVLSFHNENMDRVVEPGEFEIMIGRSSADYQSVIFAIE